MQLTGYTTWHGDNGVDFSPPWPNTWGNKSPSNLKWQGLYAEQKGSFSVKENGQSETCCKEIWNCREICQATDGRRQFPRAAVLAHLLQAASLSSAHSSWKSAYLSWISHFRLKVGKIRKHFCHIHTVNTLVVFISSFHILVGLFLRLVFLICKTATTKSF